MSAQLADAGRSALSAAASGAAVAEWPWSASHASRWSTRFEPRRPVLEWAAGKCELRHVWRRPSGFGDMCHGMPRVDRL